MDVQIDIKKEWFEKNKDKFIAEYNNDKFVDEKDKNLYYRISYDLGSKNDSVTVDEEGNFSGQGGDDDIYVTIGVTPDIQTLINLSQVITKYFNKAKSLFEDIK